MAEANQEYDKAIYDMALLAVDMNPEDAERLMATLPPGMANDVMMLVTAKKEADAAKAPASAKGSSGAPITPEKDGEIQADKVQQPPQEGPPAPAMTKKEVYELAAKEVDKKAAQKGFERAIVSDVVSGGRVRDAVREDGMDKLAKSDLAKLDLSGFKEKAGSLVAAMFNTMQDSGTGRLAPQLADNGGSQRLPLDGQMLVTSGEKTVTT